MAYPWGDDIKLKGKTMANCNGCGSQWDFVQTAPVGSFAPNLFGLYDMVGNVWEWTEDCYHGDYNAAPTDGSAWTSGNCLSQLDEFGSMLLMTRYVIRGGFGTKIRRNLRSASRRGTQPA